MQQKLVLVGALFTIPMHGFDEPMTGLDPRFLYT